MSKKITGAEYPLSKIFSSDFDFIIPAYQRPYAWTTDESGELFDDLYSFFSQELEDSYFLGSIVLIKDETKPFAEVIDGQQRLTTLTILLAAIATKLTDTREQFLKYICEPGNPFEGLSPKPRLALRERDNQFFAQYIQSLDFEGLDKIDAKQLENEAQQNIKNNALELSKKIDKYLGNEQKRLCDFGAFLVLRCYLVAVSTPSQQSAFRVFSVLNSRGLDLLHTDIIKSDIIGRIAENKRGDFTDKWEDLEVRIGRKDFELLFNHIRMVYAKSKPKRNLLDEFKEHVMQEGVKLEELFLNVIEPLADAFIIAKNSQYVSTDNAKAINNLFAWLNRVDNSDWLPPAILFLSQKKNEASYVLWFLQKLERLTAYLHITSKNVNDRIERYALVIKELQQDHSLDNPPSTVELTLKEQSEMFDKLNRDVYLMTPRKRNYLILRLDSFLADGAAVYDPAVLTIEHVLPQTVDENSEWSKLWSSLDDRSLWVHRIANLLPLTQKRNSAAQNYDFARKKEAYFGGNKNITSYAITTQILNTASWTKQDLEKRQFDLLSVLSDKWDLNVDVNIDKELKPLIGNLVKIEQNGVVRPKNGTETGRVWLICDNLFEQNKIVPKRNFVLSETAKMQINPATASTQFARWKKFHSLVGEQT
jgi:uncharacterized protein with ParB-like and HNH nuclease domain